MRMPIQAPQWTEFLSCPVCTNQFDAQRKPISLGCGHTICKTCLFSLHRKQCPFDQTNITIDIEKLPVNTALLLLVNSSLNSHENDNAADNRAVVEHKIVAEDDYKSYVESQKCVESLANLLKPFSAGNICNSNLSRPMQRKVVTLINCQLVENEGRLRALRAARSLGERTVTELILQHQNPQQLSANLWAAVRGRGCQFLGPAMQEEVLKLVLLALEDGSALSRKVLVMFVVQRLEPHFSQASKTSIGHVVQLLYRASCFKVSKRDGDSSLMQLKEEFRSYEALRREHDAQIVQIATESGLRIAPDQWSSLLYGDIVHKSQMQSIMDKLQSPQSFAQSVQELVIALQRTGDPGKLSVLRCHLDLLATIDISPECSPPTWKECSESLQAVRNVVLGLVDFIQHHGNRKVQDTTHTQHSKYKISMCRDLSTKGSCPRGTNCTFAHSTNELEKFRSKNRKSNPQRSPHNDIMADMQSFRDDSASQIVQIVGLQPNASQTTNLFPSQTAPNQSSHALIGPPALNPQQSMVALPHFYDMPPVYHHIHHPLHSHFTHPKQQQLGSSSFYKPTTFSNVPLPSTIFAANASTNAPSNISTHSYGIADVYSAAGQHGVLFCTSPTSTTAPVAAPFPLEQITTKKVRNLPINLDTTSLALNAKILPTKSLADFCQRKVEVIAQLEKLVGKNAATVISTSASNFARQESRDVDSPTSPYTFWPTHVNSGPTFVRSDSILAADDDFVSYDTPSVSKYGPISRMPKEGPVNPSSPTPKWFFNPQTTMANGASTMLQSPPEGFIIGSPSVLIQRIQDPSKELHAESHRVKTQIRNLEKQLNDLKATSLSEGDRLTQELKIIEQGIQEKHKEACLDHIFASWNQAQGKFAYSDEDTDIVNDMHKLELRLQEALEENDG